MDIDEHNEEIRACTRCRLHENRTQAVPNQGNPDADVMIVGKMVGYKDDTVGLPYQGEAGNVLDYALESAGRTRKDVFLTNLTRCYPPESRDPRKDELDRCAQYFDRELEIVNPDVIVALGKLVAERLLGRDVSIEEEHGTRHTYNTLTYRGEVFVTYNVGAATYEPGLRDVIVEDIGLALGSS
ncbi:MAG: uracil-DNA glycosylase [Halobacteriales archaeon]|nr:uracil-DNA glycosylase [Halobacteriales archaeon]